jgi:thiamine biosynthesis lipoprotein
VIGIRHVEHVMGTVVSIDVRDESIGQEVIDEVTAWLHHVDDIFSPYRDDSPISRIGGGEITPDQAGAEVAGVLALCEQARIDTNGAFDVHRVPAPNGSTFDPSGLVKGWSIERAAALLEQRGASNFSVNAGGDVTIRGEPGPDARWRIGIRHPERADKLAAVIEAQGRLAVATSASYERGDHIVDPRTGEPARELVSVTVIGPDLTWVDTYATALFVMGLDGLRWLAQHRPDHEALAITPGARVYSTAGFDRYRAS